MSCFLGQVTSLLVVFRCNYDPCSQYSMYLNTRVYGRSFSHSPNALVFYPNEIRMALRDDMDHVSAARGTKS